MTDHEATKSSRSGKVTKADSPVQVGPGLQTQFASYPLAKPIYVKGSTALHRCDPNAEDICECMYDPACTGRFGGQMVRVPLWLSFMLRPRRQFAVLRARRILKANGVWRG